MGKATKFNVLFNSMKEENMRELKQTGKYIDINRDAGRKGLTPGKRISRFGKVYWETRKNRSDASGSDI